MRRLLPLLLLLACSSAEEPDPGVALEFQFPLDPVDEPLVAAGATGQAVHWLEGDWSIPEKNGIWLLKEGGIIRAEIPAADSRLTLVAQTTPELAAAEQTLTILVNDIELTQVVVPKWGPLKPLSFDIPGVWFGAAIDRIQFECSTHLDTAGERPLAVRIQQLKLEQAGPLPTPPTTDEWWDPSHWTTASVAPQAGRTVKHSPDVLVIVLDAARADHLGAYGYGRDTTPFIDSLAGEGVLLSDLHSVAPFTRCSMPSFLTGTPWYAHGMALNHDVLPEQIPTVAELFGQMGYQRLALSESPHVSFASGLDRGFESFWESWKRPERDELEGDLPLVSLFERLLSQELDERPAFTLVHMIPPHVPYTPSREFDLWAEDDPRRQWTSASADDLKAFRRGDRKLEPAQLRRLIALYDGNLRRGDDLTRQLVEHWQSLGRSRPLHVLITSDHGEALGEHGMFGHNFSIRTEMTRIPGVLWPRSAFDELVGREGRLWSNEDLLPLMLRSVGFSTAKAVLLPKPFAEILAGSDYERPAVLMRSLREVGARSPSGSYSFSRRYGPREFDLLRDPGFREPVRPGLESDLPDWVRGIGSLIRGVSGDAGQVDTLDETDIERLRALGYTD